MTTLQQFATKDDYTTMKTSLLYGQQTFEIKLLKQNVAIIKIIKICLTELFHHLGPFFSGLCTFSPEKRQVICWSGEQRDMLTQNGATLLK